LHCFALLQKKYVITYNDLLCRYGTGVRLPWRNN